MTIKNVSYLKLTAHCAVNLCMLAQSSGYSNISSGSDHSENLISRQTLMSGHTIESLSIRDKIEMHTSEFVKKSSSSKNGITHITVAHVRTPVVITVVTWLISRRQVGSLDVSKKRSLQSAQAS